MTSGKFCSIYAILLVSGNFHREVIEVYTGLFPSIHLSSECHCPPSHPLIDTNNPAVCVQHPPNQGRIDRINPQAHPPSFANDFGTNQGWISAAGDRNVNITFQLTNSLYEVRGGGLLIYL